MKARFVLLVVATLALASACATGEPPLTYTSASASESVDPLATAVLFTEAVLAQRYDVAAKLASPESPAAAFVAHRRLSGEAVLAVGWSVPAIHTEVVEDGSAVVIQYPSGTLVEWADWNFDDGEVAAWSTKRGPIEDRLAREGRRVRVDGGAVRLASAFVAEDGSLNVVVRVAAHRDLAPDYTPTWDGEPADKAYAPSTVYDGTTANLLFVWSDGEIQGEIKYTVRSAESSPIDKATLKLTPR